MAIRSPSLHERRASEVERGERLLRLRRARRPRRLSRSSAVCRRLFERARYAERRFIWTSPKSGVSGQVLRRLAEATGELARVATEGRPRGPVRSDRRRQDLAVNGRKAGSASSSSSAKDPAAILGLEARGTADDAALYGAVSTNLSHRQSWQGREKASRCLHPREWRGSSVAGVRGIGSEETRRRVDFGNPLPRRYLCRPPDSGPGWSCSKRSCATLWP